MVIRKIYYICNCTVDRKTRNIFCIHFLVLCNATWSFIYHILLLNVTNCRLSIGIFLLLVGWLQEKTMKTITGELCFSSLTKYTLLLEWNYFACYFSIFSFLSFILTPRERHVMDEVVSFVDFKKLVCKIKKDTENRVWPIYQNY